MSDHQDDLLLNSGSGNPAGFERIYECQYCPKSFKSTGTTIVRPRIEPKPTEFVCPVEFCDQKFDNFIELKNHLDELHGMSYRISSKCKMCHLKYEKSYLMICHFLIEHKNVSGTEIAEQEIPEQKPSLEDIKLEIPDSPIDLETKCPQCEIDFNDVKMYLIHKTTHSQFHPFECAFCGQESGNKYDFMSHFYSNHSI
ncbi:Protein CBG19517 [Caenorhabditis briggsae]|uniref:Protein CBG19517 n=1 Tax=Caenorhabditis briggsae TaxID=6238 RepID=A8XVT0_CAEBR|nr:Protein CBG19517 [Caenorhabditis briggsae]CAP36749.2 Protein CBG19517 [Caenorhabditis briggsae]